MFCIDVHKICFINTSYKKRVISVGLHRAWLWNKTFQPSSRRSLWSPLKIGRPILNTASHQAIESCKQAASFPGQDHPYELLHTCTQRTHIFFPFRWSNSYAPWTPHRSYVYVSVPLLKSSVRHLFCCMVPYSLHVHEYSGYFFKLSLFRHRPEWIYIYIYLYIYIYMCVCVCVGVCIYLGCGSSLVYSKPFV